MRLRRKLTIAFFLTSSVVSVLLAFFLYRFIEDHLGDEVHERLRDITLIGARTVDTPTITRLRERLATVAAIEAPEAEGSAAAPPDPYDTMVEVDAVEHGEDYARIYNELRHLRSVEPDHLLRFAYILTPSDKPDVPRFLVDADVLEWRG